MFKYSVYTSWSDEDKCYIAIIPEFPGLSAFGDTPEEAVAEAKIAAKGFIKVFKEDGGEIPVPHKFAARSGQMRLRLPKTLHAVLVQEAKAEGVSLNSYIVQLLSGRHMAHKVDKRLETIQNLLMNSFWGETKAEAGLAESQIIIQETKTDDIELRTLSK